MPEAPPQRSRREADAALEALRDAAQAQTHGTICLAGPPGPARDRLLEALAERLGPSFRSVRIREAEPSPSGLWTGVAQSLGFTPGYDARRRVIHHLADLVQRQAALLLLVDAADTLPADTLASLVTNARAEVGLHVVLAAASERALAGPLPEDVTLVHWGGEPLAEPEPRAPAPREIAPRAPAAHDASEERPVMPAVAPRRAARASKRAGRGRAAWVLAALALSAGLGLLLARSLPGVRSAPTSPTGSAARAPEPVTPEPRSEAAAPPLPEAAPAAPPPAAEAAPATEAEVAAEAPPGGDAKPAPPPSEPGEQAASPPPSEPVEPEAQAASEAAVEPEAQPAPAAAVEPVAEAAPAAPPEPERAAEPEPDPAPPAPEPAPVAPAVAPRAAERKPPEPAAPLARGALRIDSESPVRIEIDGRPYGRTPVAGVRLARGVHRVVARYPDGATALKTVTLGDQDVSVFFR